MKKLARINKILRSFQTKCHADADLGLDADLELLENRLTHLEERIDFKKVMLIAINANITELLDRPSTITDLKRQLAELTATFNQFKFIAKKIVDEFKATRNGEGKLVYPRFEELKDLICALLLDGQADSPKQAYEMAERFDGKQDSKKQ